MKTYQYQLIRYQHDHFSGEFVNLGVVVYAPEERFLQAKVTHRYNRLHEFFPEANGRFTKKMLHYIEREVYRISKELTELFVPQTELATLTARILPPDNNVIRFSEVRTGLDIDMHAALQYLYFDMVEKHALSDKETASLKDEDVWKNKYKAYFDKYKVSEVLHSHVVETPNDTFEFDYAWKNEIWHCYEPVSFFLVNKEAIKDKVYKWAGKVKELQESKERIHLTLLTSLNPQFNDLQQFMTRFIETNNKQANITVDVVLDTEAEQLASNIRRQIDKHNAEH